MYKFMTSAKLLLLMVGGLLGMLTTGSNASAAKVYPDRGSFVLVNPTTETVKYQMRWGAGPWQSYTLEPGDKRYHSYTLDEDGDVPAPQVRFDYIFNDSDLTFWSYNLDVYPVSNAWFGKHYRFRYLLNDGIMVLE